MLDSYPMAKYPKINSLWKRDERGRVISGQYADPETEYLKDNLWEWTEKVDGTNIRLGWDRGTRGHEVAYIAGRTDSAQIPAHLLTNLAAMMANRQDEMGQAFASARYVTLYGEGYGAKIQSGGNYRPDAGFVLFDVEVTGGDGRPWWMSRAAVREIGEDLRLDVVPTVATCTVVEAIELVAANGFSSNWQNVARPEGLVGRPLGDLRKRNGDLVVTKIKAKDFA